ncbi:MAG: leucine-rich repeat protein [Bacteroidales bacterium]|nr:leucine-rich repeat protein [Bacteroidales bacterium]
MKYTALYWAMRFFEYEADIFTKKYPDGTEIKILANKNKVLINDKEAFLLNTHESFVQLEFIDNYLKNQICALDDIKVFSDHIKLFNKNIKFVIWDNDFNSIDATENDLAYKSRLISGVIENETKFYHNNQWFDYWDGINAWNNENVVDKNKDFIIKNSRLMKYEGKEKIVNIPLGITSIESCAFWDNQFVEEVNIPEHVVNIGGDTFYNCKNLKKVNIPEECTLMGNNPFAGCPKIKIINNSKEYKLVDGILYTKDMKTLIYYPMNDKRKEYVVPEGVEVICKHVFFLCDQLEKIVLPTTLKKMENNPFSGCTKLRIDNKSPFYHIIDDVIYNQFKTSVVGVLNKINAKELIIPEGIKTINRNSFWNCKGIRKIVFPSSLEDIGYNPFVGCSNIHFESLSKAYKVVDDVLYTADMKKIVCYPSWKAVGSIFVPDSVTTLERGAFSGCDKMTEINLHNINKINKSCFTNCNSLTNVYCSDLITYIGEWAFAHCLSLKSVSVYKDTIVDNNALANCNAKLIIRNSLTNTLIESENLFSLESMKSRFKNKINSILIDPPYNSNIDYIGYKDSDFENGYQKFIEQRLLIAKQLLSEEGILVINIDEGGLKDIKEVCYRIFTRDLVSIHKWKKKHPYFDVNRVVLNPNKIQTDFEYIVVCRNSSKSVLKKIQQPYIENGKILEKTSEFPQIFDCFGTTSSAKDEVKEIFGTREYFSTPKPVKLIKEFARATTKKNSIVLDFFAGSGTTGQAVDELNKEDGGSRTTILISNSESEICEKITNTRLKKKGVNFVYLK